MKEDRVPRTQERRSDPKCNVAEMKKADKNEIRRRRHVEKAEGEIAARIKGATEQNNNKMKQKLNVANVLRPGDKQFPTGARIRLRLRQTPRPHPTGTGLAKVNGVLRTY